MKTLVYLFIVILLLGCANGGGGGGSDETEPIIESVELYQWIDGERIVKTTFIIDEIFSMQMIATDPDRDMKIYYVDIVGPMTDQQRSNDIPPADADTIEIYDYHNRVWDFANWYGQYSVCFWIVDKAGNESDDFCMTITVVDYPEL